MYKPLYLTDIVWFREMDRRNQMRAWGTINKHGPGRDVEQDKLNYDYIWGQYGYV